MKMILFLINNYIRMYNLQLNGKLSDKNIQILYSELDFAKKIFGNSDLFSQLNETKKIVVGIITKIKENLNYDNNIDFTKEIILLNLKIELNILYIRYSNNSKENDFYTVIEKIISKNFSPEGITKSGEAVKDIVKILSKAKEKGIQKEVIVDFYEEIYFNNMEDFYKNNPLKDFVGENLFKKMFGNFNKK